MLWRKKYTHKLPHLQTVPKSSILCDYNVPHTCISEMEMFCKTLSTGCQVLLWNKPIKSLWSQLILFYCKLLWISGFVQSVLCDFRLRIFSAGGVIVKQIDQEKTWTHSVYPILTLICIQTEVSIIDIRKKSTILSAVCKESELVIFSFCRSRSWGNFAHFRTLGQTRTSCSNNKLNSL